MKNRNSNLTSLLAGISVLALAATTSNAALLAIDFNHNTSPTATSFIGQNSGNPGITHTTTAGNITVSYTDQQATFDRANPSGDNQIDNLYRDFIFDNNSNGFTITLSGAGIIASTDYILTFYAYDSGEIRRTAVQGSAGTVGTKLEGFKRSRTAPTTLDEYADSGTFTSSATGTLTFFVDGSGGGTVGTAGRSSINGFQLDVVPEPSVALLGGLGVLSLLRRRR